MVTKNHDSFRLHPVRGQPLPEYMMMTPVSASRAFPWQEHSFSYSYHHLHRSFAAKSETLFTMMDRRDIYPYSIPVDREEVTRSGALTTLPVRIHRHNHLADAGALCLVNDWRHTMKDGQETRSNGSPCVVGNWASFIWPER